ncbi:MAG: DUF2971 domain-containing protein [Bacteroides sp.]|nr:DUF2971 domain-containing protein [Bacteroides sp.]
MQNIYSPPAGQWKQKRIPQWGLYAGKSRGVRIALDSDKMFNNFIRTIHFDRSQHSAQEYNDFVVGKAVRLDDRRWLFPCVFNDGSWSGFPYYLFHGATNPLRSGMCIIPHRYFKDFFVEVEYIEDVNSSYEDCFQVKHNNNGTYDFKFKTKVGYKKSKDWEFQKEVRFILFMMHTVPQHISGDLYIDYPSANFTEYNFPPQRYDGRELLYYDMKLDDDAFDHLEITLGPELSIKDKERVSTLLQRYAPTAKIFPSSVRTNFNRI